MPASMHVPLLGLMWLHAVMGEPFFMLIPPSVLKCIMFWIYLVLFRWKEPGINFLKSIELWQKKQVSESEPYGAWAFLSHLPE